MKKIIGLGNSRMCKIILLAMLACVIIMTGDSAAISTKKVLIVADNERLTDPVISKVMDMVQNESASVEVSNRLHLKSAEAGLFDAILIVEPLRNGKTQHRVKVLANEGFKSKIIHFNVEREEYWKEKNDKTGKDTDQSGAIAASLFDKILAVLNK